MWGTLKLRARRGPPALLHLELGRLMMYSVVQFFAGIVLVVGGAIFLLSAIYNTGYRGAFSGGPLLPMSNAGRIVSGLIGAVLLIAGAIRLFRLFFH